MAGIYKRGSDKDRRGGKYTAWWIDRNGKKQQAVGSASRDQTLAMASAHEAEEKAIREGTVDPGDRKRRESTLKPVADHVEDYRLDLLAKGGTEKHANHIASVLIRLSADASIVSVSDIPPDQIQSALGRMKAKGRSARTVNHARAAIRAFGAWLEDAGRIKEAPRLKSLSMLPEQSDRRRERRALTAGEVVRLLDATVRGPDFTTRRNTRSDRKITATMSGPEREVCYRTALATGFRAHELGTLTPESFRLDGDEPTITVEACYSKRGKRSGRADVQPIRRDVAESLKAWLATKEPGVPVFPLPKLSAAKMLASDLRAAGIEPVDVKGRVVDFHALRYTFITLMVMSGKNVKLVQRLARHSTAELTLGRYTSVDDGDIREALEGEGK